MKIELLTRNQEQVDKLTNLVYDLIEESGLQIIPKGGMRSKTRPIDYEISDFNLRKKKIGKYEYRLKDGVYQVKVEIEIPEIYDSLYGKISKLYPGLLEPVGQ